MGISGVIQDPTMANLMLDLNPEKSCLMRELGVWPQQIGITSHKTLYQTNI